MNENTGLFLNGFDVWYKNICASFNTNGRTWIQQSKIPKDINLLLNQIAKNGFFYAYGYVQRPTSKVCYRFKIDKIVHNYNRIPPPDKTAPPIAEYDVSQGGCTDGEYKYPMWLSVQEINRVGPYDMNRFININNNKPINSVMGKANYVIEIPNDIITGEPTTQNEQIQNQNPSFIQNIQTNDIDFGISISIEKDLQRFLSHNLDSIEKGLHSYKGGTEYQVSTGRIDILCKDKNDKFVVIELKAGKANLEVFAQIMSYIAALKSDVAKDNDVRGIIIAREFDDRLIITAKISNISLLTYNVKFDFKEIK